jgi:DNA-binding PadR family transcriptional regulator
VGAKKGIGYINPYMTKDVRKMIFKLVILRRIKEGKTYSYALIKEMNNHPYVQKFLEKRSTSVKNDIYNTINALEKSGYLKVNAKMENGRVKKYYSLTEKGSRVLEDSKKVFMNSMKALASMLK